MNTRRLQQSTISFTRNKGNSPAKESSQKGTEDTQLQCPVCGKFNSIHKNDLDKHKIMFVENSDKNTYIIKETRIIKDIIMIAVSLSVGFIGAMLIISIFGT